MATYTLSPNVKRQLLDNSGNPLSAGKLYTVEAGGTYPADAVTVYQTSSGTAHTNPIVLDSAGRISGSSEIYLEPGQSYKYILTTSADVAVWTQDNILGPPATTASLEFLVTLGANVDAGELLYLSDGTAITAGTWGKADADTPYSSTLPELGFAVTAGSTGGTIQVRQGGLITLAGPLNPGSKYYASATAGAITATAPVLARYVGQAISTTQLVIAATMADSATEDVVIAPRIKDVCDGRLSLTTGVPVTTGDVTAAATLYWVPYKGNTIALYSGARWITFQQAQLSIAAPAAATTVYDAFMDYNAGVPALLLAAWNSATARHAAGIYATVLPTQDGVFVQSTDGTVVAPTKRYLGTVRTVSASQFNDSLTLRHVWNYYHRVARDMRRFESTASWTYNLSTLRQVNASAANQLDFVIGVSEDQVWASIQGAANNATGAIAVFNSIGLDSTTAIAAGTNGGNNYIQVGNTPVCLSADWTGYPGVGRHILTWLERVEVAGAASTLYGDNQPAGFGEHHGIIGGLLG